MKEAAVPERGRGFFGASDRTPYPVFRSVDDDQALLQLPATHLRKHVEENGMNAARSRRNDHGVGSE